MQNTAAIEQLKILRDETDRKMLSGESYSSLVEKYNRILEKNLESNLIDAPLPDWARLDDWQISKKYLEQERIWERASKYPFANFVRDERIALICEFKVLSVRFSDIYVRCLKNIKGTAPLRFDFKTIVPWGFDYHSWFHQGEYCLGFFWNDLTPWGNLGRVPICRIQTKEVAIFYGDAPFLFELEPWEIEFDGKPALAIELERLEKAFNAALNHDEKSSSGGW